MCDSFFFISCDLERKWAKKNNNMLKYVMVEGKLAGRLRCHGVLSKVFFWKIWNCQISHRSFSRGSMCMNSNQFCGLFERSWPEELPREPNTFKDCFLLAFTKPIGTLMWLYPSSGECSTFSCTKTVSQVPTSCLPSFWEDAVTNSLPNALQNNNNVSALLVCASENLDESRCSTNEWKLRA